MSHLDEYARGNTPPPALVLDADQRSALAVTRSLGQRGITVVTADTHRPTLAGASRFAHSSEVYADPAAEPARFLRDIRGLAQEYGAGAVLPATEVTTYVLAQADAASSPGSLACTPFESFQLLSDKYRLFRLATEIGVPIPPTRFVERADEASALAAELGYPVVVKPYRSRVPVDGEWHSGTVRVADSETELRAIVAADPALREHHFLLQGYIEGTGQGLFAAYDKGEAVALFAHRRLREKPPSGGVSVLSESVPVPEPMREIATRLLDEAGWQGLAMVEFKVAADGTPFLIEVNPRLWGSLQLAVDAGVDFPWLLYQLCIGRETDRVTGYRHGRRLRWLLGDLDRLYLVLRDRDTPWPRRLQEIGHFLRPDFHRVRHEIDRLEDPGPFRHELTGYLRALLPARGARA